MKITPLIIFFSLCAIAGAIVPWYFNIQFMVQSGEMLTFEKLFAAGFTNSLTSSLTSDFLIATTPLLVWMMVEGKRLQMKYLWAYILVTFLIAFAFACPLFLLMREIHLQKTASKEAHK